MRIVIFTIAIVFVCFSSRARADIDLAYYGYGGAFGWSHNTAVYAPAGFGANPTDIPGNGLHFFDPLWSQNLPRSVWLEGLFLNTTTSYSDSLSLSQNIVGSFESSFATTGQNKQFDIYQYTYTGFTVSQTGYYEFQYEAGGLFNHGRYPVFGPSYAYAGTDSVFNIYEQNGGPPSSLAKFSLSAGAGGTNDNQPFNTAMPGDSVSKSMDQQVFLEAGKLYQADIYSYSYIGGDGYFSGSTSIRNSLYITAVPEPTSLAALGAAACATSAAHTYRKRRLRKRLSLTA